MWDFTRPCYANGTPRPMMRGWLHAVFSLVWCVCAVLCFVTWHPRLYLMCVGKLISYVASANYHLCPVGGDVLREAAYLSVDYMAIPVSMWASAVPFQQSFVEWFVYWLLMLVTVGNGLVLVNRDTSRNILYFLFFFACISNIGYRCALGGQLQTWGMGTVFYLLAFYLSPANKPPMGVRPWPPAPWHHSRVSGWHDDFHLVLLIADFWFARMAVVATVLELRESESGEGWAHRIFLSQS